MTSSLQLGVSTEERRRIEAIQQDVASAIQDGVFESVPDLAAQLRSVADTFDAQMKATHAGRRVIGWCLRQLNTFPRWGAWQYHSFVSDRTTSAFPAIVGAIVVLLRDATWPPNAGTVGQFRYTTEAESFIPGRA